MPQVGPNDHLKRVAKASGIPAPVEDTKTVKIPEEVTEAPKPKRRRKKVAKAENGASV